MPPPNEMKTKYDAKSKFLSFHWFFQKNKNSSQSSKEIVVNTTVPMSKSFDATLDRYPKYLLWKLLPGKSSAPSHVCPRSLPFRSSFSCNDVYSLCHLNRSTQTLCSSGIKNSLGIVMHPCQSLHNLCKSQTGVCNEKMMFIKSGEAFTDTTVTAMCKLCLVLRPAENMYSLQDCNCIFCLECLYHYLNINIREGKIPITCPDANCSVPGRILVSEIKEIAGNDAVVLFERYKLNLDVERDPTRVWCPAPGCETVCSFQPSTNPDTGAPATCVTCRLKFCTLCKGRWHARESCEEANKVFLEDLDCSGSDEDGWIKQCPNCRIPIEKDEGCAQMMCYRCKHVFCWHCLASLDDDFLLRHYDKGPCRDKLGHSRASMIWHRTQVIGIFAGFSFLLLMASPFLLLAAPCLLCCRCKHKFFYERGTML